MFYSFGDNSTTKLFIQSSAGPRKRKSSINIIVTNVVAEVIGYCGSPTQQNNKYPKKPQTLIDHASHGGQRWRRRRTWPIIIIHREHFGLLTKSATETEATINSTTLLYWISCTTRDKNLLFLVNPSTTNAARHWYCIQAFHLLQHHLSSELFWWPRRINIWYFKHSHPFPSRLVLLQR